MGELTVTTVAITGNNASGVQAGSGGDEWDNYNGDTLLVVENGSTTSIVATFTAQTGPDGLTITDPTATIASGLYVAGPFPPQWFNDTDGHVNVSYDEASGVFVKALKLKGA